MNVMNIPNVYSMSLLGITIGFSFTRKTIINREIFLKCIDISWRFIKSVCLYYQITRTDN